MHTKGPWNHHKAPAIGGGTIHVIQAGQSHGITVCTIRAGIDKGNSDRIDEICEANAKLISAAPELLEALEAYVSKDFEMGGTSSKAEIHNARLNAARAAIKKARG